MPMSHSPMTRPLGPRRKGRHAGPTPAAGRVPPPPRSRSRPGPPPPRIRRPRHLKAVAVASALLLCLLVAGGAGAFSHLWAFLDYGAGVLSLVSLNATVLWGLAATDRLVLHSDHRLLAQGVHRGLAVAGLGFLVLHILVKVAESRTTATAAAVPFTDTDQPLLIGLGTLAGYLFVAVAVTGAVRSAFARAKGSSRRRSRWWRALHMGAYPAWGAALVHGLKSGRPASGWVTAGYALCLLGVAVTLMIRLRSRHSPAPGGTGNTGPIPIPAQRRVPEPGPAGPVPVRPGARPDEPLGASRGWGR